MFPVVGIIIIGQSLILKSVVALMEVGFFTRPLVGICWSFLLCLPISLFLRVIFVVSSVLRCIVANHLLLRLPLIFCWLILCSHLQCCLHLLLSYLRYSLNMGCVSDVYLRMKFFFFDIIFLYFFANLKVKFVNGC